MPIAGAADLTSTFDAATDGWTASAGTTVVTLEPSGGASAGFLQGFGTGGSWHYVSPPAWSGNWAAYKTLKFDLGIPSRHYADNDSAGMVVITGANAQTMTWTGATPLWTWTHFDVSLIPVSFGVDQATFDGIMASVASVQILGEFTALENETVGLDNVVLTTTPVTVHGADLVERFTAAVQAPGDNSVNGWSPVDDVTLAPTLSGVPLYGLYCDDWQDGRNFKVASPQSWAGDWRAFTEIRFDANWSSNVGSTAGTDLVTVFGANGQRLTWSTNLTEAVWNHVIVPLTPAAFGVDAATFQGVMSHVSKIELRGEYDGGNDQFYLDNIAVATGPETGRQLGSSVVSRFGSGSEDWTVYGGATLAWNATGGFSGGGVIATEVAAGTVRFLSPDTWSGDWSDFANMRFMMRSLASSRPTISPTVTIWGFNGGSFSYSPPAPWNSWSPYTIDLTPLNFGVTQEVFDAVMSNVAHVTIVADVLSSTDVTALDDVSLTVAGPPMGAPPGLQSIFSTDNENWRKGRWSGSAWFLLPIVPDHILEGNPDGSIAVGEEGGTAYWFTPEIWAGDWRGQQSTSFDLRILTGTSRLAAGNMLTIISVHGFMQQAVPAAPALDVWNHYEFALTPAAFGVTQQTFDTIMRDVVMMGIRSEWISTSGQREALDNVNVSVSSAAYRLWLATYFTPAQLADPSITGVDADPDHDDSSNFGEYLALTIPTDPLSRFQPLARLVSGGIEIEYTTRIGRTYQVWKSTTLANDWQPVGPLVTGDDTLKIYLAPTNSARGFFIVRPSVP